MVYCNCTIPFNATLSILRRLVVVVVVVFFFLAKGSATSQARDRKIGRTLTACWVNLMLIKFTCKRLMLLVLRANRVASFACYGEDINVQEICKQ